MNTQKVLELHKQWLRDEGGRRADLQGADLQEAELGEGGFMKWKQMS